MTFLLVLRVLSAIFVGFCASFSYFPPFPIFPLTISSSQLHTAIQNTVARSLRARRESLSSPSSTDTPPDSDDDDAVALALAAVSSARLPVHVEGKASFNNIKVSVPLQDGAWTYTDTTTLRPLVGYLNSRTTTLPLNISVDLPITLFDGAWSFYDHGISELLGNAAYDSFVAVVSDEHRRSRRMRKVGVWVLKEISRGVGHFWAEARGRPLQHI